MDREPLIAVQSLFVLVFKVGEETVFKQRVVLPETREALAGLFPKAFNHPDLLGLLEHLLFSTFVDKDDEDLVVVNATTLARIEGKQSAHQGRNYRGMDLLEAFQREVMELEVANYQRLEGKARTVRRPTGPELDRALQREFTSSRAERKERGVYLVSGDKPPKQPPRKQVQVEKAALQEQIERIQHFVPTDHPATKWLHFLNTQPDRALKNIVERNLESARQLALDSKSFKNSTKAYNLRLLHDIEDDPKSLYQVSAADRTVRLFPVGSTYLSLSRDIRKALMKGCHEFDLAAAQLTLASHVWKVPSLENQELADKILLDPWKMVARQAGLEVSTYGPTPTQKPALKKAIYTLLFGGGSGRVREELLKPTSGEPLTEAQAAMFLQSDVVRDIFNAQKARQEQYRRDGGFTDVFGRWRPLQADEKGAGVRSLMAQELQVYELFVLKPGLDYLLELGTAQVTVMAWQHDGLTLHFKDASKAKSHIGRMNQRVNHQAIHVLGIPWWKFKLEGVRL